MEGNYFAVSIATPSGMAYEGRVNLLELPTVEGRIGILPGHAHLLTALDVGWVRITSEQHDWRWFLAGGFARIYPERVLVTTPVLKKDFDTTILQEAILEAEEFFADTDDAQMLREHLGTGKK